MKKQVALREDKNFITLGQLLKSEGFVGSGGEARFFLEKKYVTVNNEHELRRGRKIYTGNCVIIDDIEIEIVGA